jgi:hypothetical protein
MTIVSQPPKIKYLTNKDLLREIHLSKNTYCTFLLPEYGEYDLIIPNLSKINIRTVAEAKRKAVWLACVNFIQWYNTNK